MNITVVKYLTATLTAFFVIVLTSHSAVEETSATDTGISKNNPLTQSEFLVLYLNAWTEERYEIMYEMMDDNLKDEMTLKDFECNLKREKKETGGLKAYELKDLKVNNSWKVTLTYNKSSYRTKTVKVNLQSYKNSWLIAGGGLTPQDMSIFDR